VTFSVTAAAVNHPPTVSGISEDSSSPFYSDEDITFSVTASDPDAGDTITYAWAINGTTLSGETGSSIARYWLASATLNPTIAVTVTDNHGLSTTQSTQVSITPAASWRVYDNASNPINNLYFRTHGVSSYGSDLLGTSTLNPGYYAVWYDVAAGSYDYKATIYYGSTEYICDTTGTMTSGVSMTLGYHRDFTLTDSSGSLPPPVWAVSANSNVVTRSLVENGSFGLPIAQGQSVVKVPMAISPKSNIFPITSLPTDEPEGVPLKR